MSQPVDTAVYPWTTRLRKITPVMQTWYRARWCIDYCGCDMAALAHGVALARSIAHLHSDAAYVTDILGTRFLSSDLKRWSDLFLDSSDVRGRAYCSKTWKGKPDTKLQHAAESGDAFSQVILARWYYQNDHPEEGRKWGMLSAQQDDPEGLVCLYYKENNHTRNAESYLERAAYLGHPEAMREYAATFSAASPARYFWLGEAAKIPGSRNTAIHLMFNTLVLNPAMVLVLPKKTLYQIWKSVKDNVTYKRLENGLLTIDRVFGAEVNHLGYTFASAQQVYTARNRLYSESTYAACRVFYRRHGMNRDVRDLVCRLIWKARYKRVFNGIKEE